MIAAALALHWVCHHGKAAPVVLSRNFGMGGAKPALVSATLAAGSTSRSREKVQPRRATFAI